MNSKIKISFFISLFFICVSYSQKADSQIFFNKPAEHFTESLPIGNGRLGAMIFGETDKETIILNEYQCGLEEKITLILLTHTYI